MGVDYYNILKVNRNASESDLRKSYRRLAMIFHPDKNPTRNKQESESKFKRISEAYDVLSDPHKRHIYDLYGEEALKSGRVPHCLGNYGSRNLSSYRFSPRDAEDVYAECFGRKAGAVENVLVPGLEELYSGVKKKLKVSKTIRDSSGWGAVENALVCSLEELYNGVKKKMKVLRTIRDSSGKVHSVEEILTIDIKPGWKKGTKVTFPEKGNNEPGIIPADVIFVVDERPHGLYTYGMEISVSFHYNRIEQIRRKFPS